MPHLTLDQLSDQYVAFARQHFRKPSTGRPTRTYKNIRSACGRVCAVPVPGSLDGGDGGLFGRLGELPADQLSAKLLYHGQQSLASDGTMTRRSVNDAIGWVRTMYRWAAEPVRELVTEDVAVCLSLVKALRIARSPAAENEPVTAVPIEQVQATCLYAPESLVAMIWTQWHTGMRPGEVVLMSKSSIDTSVDPWIYRPVEHKSEHFAKRRFIPLGPRAQEALLPLLAVARRDWLFDAIQRCRPPGKPVTETAYCRAIGAINTKHGLAEWTPNQIRHAFATRVERSDGRKAAQLLLGHSSERTTEIYIDPDTQAVIELARRHG